MNPSRQDRCPPGQTLLATAGCVSDPGCADEDLCLASTGTWHPAEEGYCGFQCGNPGDCQACMDSCDCGPHRSFAPAQGCMIDPLCEQVDQGTLCVASGGTWHACGSGEPCSCGHYQCGFPNTVDPCVAPGCDCGPLSNFDQGIGCVLSGGCTLRNEGQECSGQGADTSSCRPGLACCQHCGTYPGCSWCEPPCCSDTPGCLDDGCFAPPP